jgi:hypothetical protein
VTGREGQPGAFDRPRLEAPGRLGQSSSSRA